MAYKRILTVQDISCVGQCSMTVALPILSACGHETCVLPSAVLSSHTGGFSSPVRVDLSEHMPAMWQHWQSEGIDFDAIYAGYLGSQRQITVVKDIFCQMCAPGGIRVLDPAMGDHGRLYKGFDEDYVYSMRGLCACADILLPNLTEAAMLTGIPYRTEPDEDYVRELLDGLRRLTDADVVLTGVSITSGKTGAAVMRGGEITYCLHKKQSENCHGTGDIFAAALVGALMSGKELTRAAAIAGEFTSHCIGTTIRCRTHWYGVRFEPELGKLMELLKR